VRVLGASGYGAEHVIASRGTFEMIRERGAQDWKSEHERFPRLFEAAEEIPGLTWPTLVFDRELTVMLGRREVRLMHVGAGHTKGDTIAWLPKERVLFSGDLVEQGATPYCGDAQLAEWPATLDALLAARLDRLPVARLLAGVYVVAALLLGGLAVSSELFSLPSVLVLALASGTLAAVARATGSATAEIQELNPQILRGMTPPRDSMLVRIPPGSRAHFDSAFSTLDSAELVGARVITNKKPASWESLARVAKVPAKAVQLYNPTVKPSKRTGIIAPGTVIMLPTPAVVAAATYVPDPGIERYGGGTRTHVVRPGENLGVIARRYGPPPAAIMRLNRLKKPIIFPGQELLVNGKGRTTSSPSKSSKTKRATSNR